MPYHHFPSRVLKERDNQKEIIHNANEYTKIVSFMIVFMIIFNIFLILSLSDIVMLSDAIKFALIISDVFFAFSSLFILAVLLYLDYKYDKSIAKEQRAYEMGKLHGQNVDFDKDFFKTKQ